MTHETFEALAENAGNPRIAPQHLPAARISPVTVESGAADYGPSSSVLALVRYVRVHGDQAARVEVEQYLGEIVLAWLRCHPNRQADCSFEGKEHYVSLTFERFWQIVVQRQGTCETLAEAFNDPNIKPTLPAYAEKYAERLSSMGWTAEVMAKSYSQAIRIIPTKFIVGA